MIYQEHFLQEVLNKTDLVELVGGYLSLKANGKRWWGCCPFHQEKTPSFTVNPQLNFYYCFGCKEKGNAFQFLMKVEGLGFTEAVEKLALKAGVELPEKNYTPQDKNRQALLELFKRLTGTFHYLLKTHPEAEVARETLARRGVSPEMIDRFQLGYALQDRTWLKKFLRSKSYTEEFLKTSGLFSSEYPDSYIFAGRLIFPIFHHTQEIIGFGGRILSNKPGPKYINSPETEVFQKRKSLYAIEHALPAIRTTQEVVLCEGYMDAISLHQAGISHAVAPLGTAFTEDHAHFLKRYCKTIVCLFDSDGAGQRATVKAIEICEPLNLETRVIILKDSKDPAEILEKEGPAGLKDLLDNWQRGFDFLLNFYYNISNQNSTLDLANFLKAVFSFVRRLPSEVKKETSLKKIADFLGVSKESIQQDFQSETSREVKRVLARKDTTLPTVESYGKTLEWAVLMASALNPLHFSLLRKNLCEADFEEARSQRLFEVLEKMASAEDFKSRGFPFDALTKELEGELWFDNFVKDMMSGEFELNSERIVADGTVRLKVKRLESLSKKISNQLNELGMSQDEMHRLVEEKSFLNKEIARLKRND